jgi:acetyl-CoA C-acetyltransferase
VHVPSRKGPVTFEVDEYIRANVDIGQLAKMKPIFKVGGTVTAGNSSGINDGAAAVVLASGEKVKALQLKPLARLMAYAHAGVDPAYMGIGPVPAARLALRRAGLGASQLDVIESNEAFAAQACAVSRELELDPDKVNSNGSGIWLGHPFTVKMRFRSKFGEIKALRRTPDYNQLVRGQTRTTTQLHAKTLAFHTR